MTQESMQMLMNGFEYKGREYPGVAQLIEDLKWALENDKWNISRENYINNGVVKLRIIMERKHTITSIFIVPTLSIGRDKLIDNGFVNGYIKDGNKRCTV